MAPRTGADILSAITTQVALIGTVDDHKAPKPNAKIDQLIIELAVAKRIKDEAEKRHEKARNAVKDEFADTLSKLDRGTHALHTSRFAALTTKVKAGQTRLDTQQLMTAMVKKFNITLEDALALITECSKQGSPVVELQAALMTVD